MNARARVALLAMLSLLAFVGCGPRRFTQNHWELAPYDKSEAFQEKDRIVVELEAPKTLPPNFSAVVQSCDQGKPLFDRNGAPYQDQISLVPPGMWVEKVTITNRTDHIIRLNQSAIRLFDPAATEHEPLDHPEWQAALAQARPCSTTAQAFPQMHMVKLLNRNVEIVPGTNFSGYLLFRPTSMTMTGVWKLALYDVPVASDAAGHVTKTTRFEVRETVKKYVDTYYQESPLKRPVLENSVAVES